MIWGSPLMYIVTILTLIALTAIDGRRRSQTRQNPQLMLLINILLVVMASVNLSMGIDRRESWSVVSDAIGIALGFTYAVVNVTRLVRQEWR